MMKSNLSAILIFVIFFACNNSKESNKKQVENNSNIELSEITNTETNSAKTESLDFLFKDRCDILDIDKVGDISNYYVYVNDFPIQEDSLTVLAKEFKSYYCSSKCNIHIVDSKEVFPLIKKYPLEGKEYLKVADHFVAMYDFDSYLWFYMFQDLKYKELGGKNWKKEIPK